MVTLRGSDQLVIRDLTDIAHPKTIGTAGRASQLLGYGPALEGAGGQFVSSSEISYLGGQTDPYYALPNTLFRRPISGAPSPVVVRGDKAVFLFVWRPDGSVAYLTTADLGLELHVLNGGRDRVLATLPALAVGGCEVEPCPGPLQNPADSWDFRLAYSPDGALISLVGSGINNYFGVWTAAGAKAGGTDPLAAATMSVWSGSSLYFLDAKGVEVLRDGAISTLLPGVKWIRPKASPDGGRIVYEARDAQGSPHVFVVDTASGKVIDLGGKGRAEPAFLTDRYVWYEAGVACLPTAGCGTEFPGIAKGKTYIYDLEEHTETSSVISSVIDVWPHAG